jgi:hypothetical protein
MKKHFLWMIVVLCSFNVSSQTFEQLAETPPMGWNSWDCFGMDVTEDEMKAIADYMAKHLKKYGWEYVVLDMGWNYGEGLNTWNFRMQNPPQEMDEYGRLIPNILKFPSAAGGKGLKPLADYVHSKGLKFGIHIMRGIPWQAVEQNTPIKGSKYKAKDIASEENLCRWYHGMFTVDMTKPGAQDYYNSLLELYAEWGVDYIKADNMISPYHTQEIEALKNATTKIGRPIVISLSAGSVPVEKGDHLRQNAHLWRITGDMWDHWSFVEKTFIQCREWQDYIRPHHWPDADMLPFGKMRINGTDGALARVIGKSPEETVNEYSRLSKDEKYTVMGLWSIFRSPLMIGGNLLDIDKHSLKLLSNEEVLDVNQNSTNNRELRTSDKEIVWIAEDPDTGGIYVALFNIGNTGPIKIKIKLNELELSGKQKVRDLWKRQNIGKFQDEFSATVNSHGCGLYKIGF